MKNEELDHIIEKSFRIEPDFHLSSNFAVNLIASVTRREKWKTYLREYLYVTTILFFLFVTACGTYYYIDKNIVTRIFSFIGQNAIPVAFILFILNFVLFADRVLLRLLFNRWNKAN
jgi:hypothetical protein